jgi:hypothetical protein
MVEFMIFLGEGGTHPPGNLYGCENKRVTEFDGCKCMKTIGWTKGRWQVVGSKERKWEGGHGVLLP